MNNPQTQGAATTVNQSSDTKRKPSKQELREQRLEQLFTSCRQQTLQQIIGPFGLTPAMFEDKTGGNVTTTHNFKQGITATEDDGNRYKQFKHNLENPTDRKIYDADLKKKRKEMFKKDEPIISSATGKELTKDGQTHIDHTRSVKSIETDPEANLFKTKEERVKMANAPENLSTIESSINQSMQDKDKLEWANSQRKKDPGKTNAESFNVDIDLLKEAKEKSDAHIKHELLKAQINKQGKELLSTGLEEAKNNAIRQAMGILMYEFVNGSYIEVSRIITEPDQQESLIDRIIAGLLRITEKVKNKLRHAFEAVISGGIQGFISNLLTYIINSVVTTSAKIVTIIREGMKSLWTAIKMIVSPPADMSADDVAREVTKIIAAVITTSLGMLFEESVKGFIMSIPLLMPLADTIAPVISGILTGLMTALTIYSIDRLFDWLSATGTEVLEAQLSKLDADAALVEKLTSFIEQQYKNSELYEVIFDKNKEILVTLENSQKNLSSATNHAAQSIEVRERTISSLQTGFTSMREMDDELESLINNYPLN